MSYSSNISCFDPVCNNLYFYILALYKYIYFCLNCLVQHVAHCISGSWLQQLIGGEHDLCDALQGTAASGQALWVSADGGKCSTCLVGDGGKCSTCLKADGGKCSTLLAVDWF